MLNRHKLALELEQSILKISPGYKNAGNDIFLCIDELLRVLPEFSLPPKPRLRADNINHETFSADSIPQHSISKSDKTKSETKTTVELTQEQHQEIINTKKLSQLRRRLVNILASESYLHLDRTLCDTAFNIQITLAKAFPLNRQVFEDKDGSPYIQETWEDPISLDVFNRDSEGLVIYSDSSILTTESAIKYYETDFAYTGEQPRNYANDVLSDREKVSLSKQGIIFRNENNRIHAVVEMERRRFEEERRPFEEEMREISQRHFEETFFRNPIVPEPIAQTAPKWQWNVYEGFFGKIGNYIGILITFLIVDVVFYSLVINFIPGVIIISSIIGLISACEWSASEEAKERVMHFINGFLVGFCCTALFGSFTNSLIIAFPYICQAMSVAPAAVTSVITFCSVSLLPITLPIVASVAIALFAYTKNYYFTSSLFMATVNSLFLPSSFIGSIGNGIDNGISYISNTLKNIFTRIYAAIVTVNSAIDVETALIPQHNSHSFIIQSLSLDPRAPRQSNIPEINLLPANASIYIASAYIVNFDLDRDLPPPAYQYR